MYIVCVVMWTHMQMHGYVYIACVEARMGHLMFCSITFYFIPFISWNLEERLPVNKLQKFPSLPLTTTTRRLGIWTPILTLARQTLFACYPSPQAYFFPVIDLPESSCSQISHLIYSLQKVEQLRFQKACKLPCLLLMFLTMTRRCDLESIFSLEKGLTAFQFEKGCARIFVWR